MAGGVFLSSEKEKLNKLKIGIQKAYTKNDGGKITRPFNRWRSHDKDLPSISPIALKAIYIANGVILSLAFPLLMNGYTMGSALLVSTGLSGIVMMYKGHSLLKGYKLRKCSESI